MSNKIANIYTRSLNLIYQCTVPRNLCCYRNDVMLTQTPRLRYKKAVFTPLIHTSFSNLVICLICDYILSTFRKQIYTIGPLPVVLQEILLNVN